MIIGLTLLTFITMVGGNPLHDAYGFRHWQHGDAMHEYIKTGDAGRFIGFWTCLLYAAFSVSGPDMIALSAGELQDPRRNIPRTVKRCFQRICGFYIIGVLAVGILCYSRDKRLISAVGGAGVGAGASPWVIGIENLMISGLPSFINAMIMISGWSCGNAYLYSASRTLYSLSLNGQAPKFLRYCTKWGCPIWCVMVVMAIGCLTFLVVSNASSVVFGWFVNLSTIAFLLSYTSMMVTFIGWWRALKAQGISRDSLPWKAPWMPYPVYFAVGFGYTIIIFSGFRAFIPFKAENFVTSYFGLAFQFVTFVGWKIYKKTKFVNPAEADLHTGKAEVDAELAHWEEPGARDDKNKMMRIWHKMW
jgi:amino acid transporter